MTFEINSYNIILTREFFMGKIRSFLLAAAVVCCLGAKSADGIKKMNVPVCKEAVEKFAAAKNFKVVLFGASNTERYAPFMH